MSGYFSVKAACSCSEISVRLYMKVTSFWPAFNWGGGGVSVAAGATGACAAAVGAATWAAGAGVAAGWAAGAAAVVAAGLAAPAASDGLAAVGATGGAGGAPQAARIGAIIVRPIMPSVLRRVMARPVVVERFIANLLHSYPAAAPPPRGSHQP